MLPVPAQFDNLPAEFGRYRLLRRLGSGGMGSVYLAEDTQLERQVALKIPHLSEDGDRELVQRFYREARAAATINHPNLCAIHDVGEVEGIHYLSMEYIEGRPLSSVIEAGKPIGDRQIALLTRKMALALAEAHARGVVHRDLKPANVMINHRGEPVITDFGLARRPESDDTQLTQTGAILGTPAYMSPEQVHADPDRIGPPTDIYSLGVILYELLAGRRPFHGSTTSLLAKIVTADPAPPSEHRADVDPALQSLCLRMMAKDPADRPASMQQVAEELTHLLRQPAGTASSTGDKQTHIKPYGRLLIRKEADRWVVAQQHAAAVDLHSLEAVITSLKQHAAISGLAKFAAYQESKRRFLWDAGEAGRLVPLTAVDSPCPPARVREIIESVGGTLQRLHALGLAAFDLSPECLFVSSDENETLLVPTPCWPQLAAGQSATAFSAPESTTGQPPAQPAASDVYALGAVAWFLLCGEPRAGESFQLPSEIDPNLAGWDAFIDGCLRTHPQRRFRSIDDALAALPGHSETETLPPTKTYIQPAPTEQGPPPPQPAALPAARRKPRRLKWLVVPLLLAALVAVVFLTAPSWLGGSSAYERGAADSVVRYADRSYEDAEWKKVEAAAGLGRIFATVIEDSGGNVVPELKSINGIDDENYTVVGTVWSANVVAGVFKRRAGHWNLAARMKLSRREAVPVLRALDAETDILASGWEHSATANQEVYVIRSSGTSTYELPQTGGQSYGIAIGPVASDMFYAFSWSPPIRVANGDMIPIREDADPDYWLQDAETDSPLADRPIYEIDHVHAFDDGEAYGIWRPQVARHASRNTRPLIVQHRQNGLWYRVDELPIDGFEWIRCAWFGRDEEGVFCVIGGVGGAVRVHHVGGKSIDQSINSGLDATSGNIRAVWGVGPEKYWAVDNNGTVWERSEDRWRVAVAGMYRDDVAFNDVWVSPTGTVFAVSSDAVYRLQ